ncbi:MAG: complex I NDUFA9 subunit family protein, partial [Robiginitomaculum sp.]|nr:complex I NDUFA9 subunit family protein [Robiginitomaculum sp.]
AKLTQFSPVLPLFAGGKNQFQPVYVGDIAAAIAILVNQGSTGETYELAGPKRYSAKEILELTLQTVDKKRLLLPMPWFIGTATGFIFEFLGAIPILNLLIKPFITRDMVTCMKTDNILSGDQAGFSKLGIKPQTVEAVLPSTLEHLKTHGQFHREVISD